ncbi:MAG: DUF6782 family putative metallopeptidase [Alphaproteobacteria bacterium]
MYTNSLKTLFVSSVAGVVALSSGANAIAEESPCDTQEVACITIAEAMQGGSDRTDLREFWDGAVEFAHTAEIDVNERFPPNWRFFFDPDLPGKGQCDKNINAASSHRFKHFRLNPEADPAFIYTTFMIHEPRHAEQKMNGAFLDAYKMDANIPEEERVVMAAFLEADARAYTIWGAYRLRDKIPGYWEAFGQRVDYKEGVEVFESSAPNETMPDAERMAAAWGDIVMFYMKDDYRLVSAIRKVQRHIENGRITPYNEAMPEDTLFSPQALDVIRALGDNTIPGANLYPDDVIEEIIIAFSGQDYKSAMVVYEDAQANNRPFCSVLPEQYMSMRNE